MTPAKRLRRLRILAGDGIVLGLAAMARCYVAGRAAAGAALADLDAAARARAVEAAGWLMRWGLRGEASAPSSGPAVCRLYQNAHDGTGGCYVCGGQKAQHADALPEVVLDASDAIALRDWQDLVRYQPSRAEVDAAACPRCGSFAVRPDTDDCKHFVCVGCAAPASPPRALAPLHYRRYGVNTTACGEPLTVPHTDRASDVVAADNACPFCEVSANGDEWDKVWP